MLLSKSARCYAAALGKATLLLYCCLPLQQSAVLFHFGFHPSKIFVDVPNVRVLVEEDLDIDFPFPARKGEYIHARTVHEAGESMAIYIYKFEGVHGCRSADPNFHGRLLTFSGNNIMTDQTLLAYKGAGELGTSFYYSPDDEPVITYDTNDGGYFIKGLPSTSLLCGEGSAEDVRGERYRTRLNDYLSRERLSQQVMSTREVKGYIARHLSKVSPFSGGGDNMLFAIDSTLIVADEDEEIDDIARSPRKGDHITITDLEYNDITSQTNQEVELQLEANMMLLMSQVLTKRLLHLKDSPITVLRSLNRAICYGISFGLIKPIVIKKLIMDFTRLELISEKKYESPKDVDKAPRLACATEYLIRRMKHQTTPHPEVSNQE